MGMFFNRNHRFPRLFALWLLGIATAVSPALVASGCSTTKGAAGSASRAAADAMLPPSEEEKLGEKFSRDVEKELQLHDDEKVQNYVREMGNRIVKAAGDSVPQGIKFEFHVVDAPKTINAFAGPGGQIYFYSGLIRKADNMAEVAAVMAHEIAHVTKRHVARRLVAAHGIDALSSAAFGEKPGLVGKLATAVAANGFLLKYSRDQERQADAVGFRYMIRTPYDPRGFVTFFRKLEGGPSPPTLLSSHPNPSERVRTIQEKIEGRSDLPSGTFEDRHRQIVERLGGSS